MTTMGRRRGGRLPARTHSLRPCLVSALSLAATAAVVVGLVGIGVVVAAADEPVDDDDDYARYRDYGTSTWVPLSSSSSSSSGAASADPVASIPDARPEEPDPVLMPAVGLGVALSFEHTYAAVTAALNAGYRGVDTAADDTYANQDQVGRAVWRWGDGGSASEERKRADVFVATKLWDDSHGFYEAVGAFHRSAREFEFLERVDLYLIHSPFGGRLIESWDALLWLRSKGLARAVGVSNFGVEHLEALKASGRPLPAVNQIEMHPLVYRRRLPLVRWCRDHGVVIQAYGSVLAGFPELLEGNNPLAQMAKRLKRTPAQVLLRWALQRGFLVIPKSTRPARIEENFDLDGFRLSRDDLTTLERWGDEVAEQEGEDEVLLYVDSWNWNPVDDAPVHLGDDPGRANSSFWARGFEDVDEERVAQVVEWAFEAESEDEDEEGWDEQGEGEEEGKEKEARGGRETDRGAVLAAARRLVASSSATSSREDIRLVLEASTLFPDKGEVDAFLDGALRSAGDLQAGEGEVGGGRRPGEGCVDEAYFADRHVANVLDVYDHDDCLRREFDVSSESFDAQEAIRVFEKCHLVVLRNVFPKKDVADLRAKIERYVGEVYAGRRRRAPGRPATTHGGDTFVVHEGGKRWNILPTRGMVPPGVVASPAVLEILSSRSILGEGENGEEFVVNHIGNINAEAGCEAQGWHVDDSYLQGQDGLRRLGVAGHDLPPYAVNLFSPLVDMTSELGPTEFCVGTSNLRGLRNGALFDVLDPTALRGGVVEGLYDFDHAPNGLCPRGFARTPLLDMGDAVLADWMVTHRGAANRSDRLRSLLFITYSRRWYHDSNLDDNVNFDDDGEDDEEENEGGDRNGVAVAAERLTRFTRFALAEEVPEALEEECQAEGGAKACAPREEGEELPPLESISDFLSAYETWSEGAL